MLEVVAKRDRHFEALLRFTTVQSFNPRTTLENLSQESLSLRAFRKATSQFSSFARDEAKFGGRHVPRLYENLSFPPSDREPLREITAGLVDSTGAMMKGLLNGMLRGALSAFFPVAYGAAMRMVDVVAPQAFSLITKR